MYLRHEIKEGMVKVAREAESMKAQVRIVVSFVCGFAAFLVWKMGRLKEVEDERGRKKRRFKGDGWRRDIGVKKKAQKKKKIGRKEKGDSEIKKVIVVVKD